MLQSFSIVIVTYNSEKYIQDLLNSIEKYILTTKNNFELEKIIIVDNNSKDNTISKIEKNIYIDVYKQPRNITHGPALDFGIKKSKSQYVLILDADTIIKKNNLLDIVLYPLIKNKNILAAGQHIYIDSYGICCEKRKNAISYIHPYCCAINKEKYLISKKKFVSHGAPGIELYDNAKKRKIEILGVFLEDTIFHYGRASCETDGGTCGSTKSINSFSYKFDKFWKESKLALRRIFGKDHKYRLRV